MFGGDRGAWVHVRSKRNNCRCINITRIVTVSTTEDREMLGVPRYLPSMNPAPKDLATYPKQSGRCPERWLAQQSYCAD